MSTEGENCNGGMQRTKTKDGYVDRSKFNKGDMLVCDRDQPDSWLFRAERYVSQQLI